MIICDGVSFSYGRRVALDDFSATIGPGLTGVLGPNGAGKSTLLSILATLRRPQFGTVEVNGIPIGDWGQIRRFLGYLPQKFEVMSSRTVRDNLEYAAWARGVDARDCPRAAEEAAERVGLGDRLSQRVGRLSGGYRQRLGFGCAIVHSPSVLLLDEPTVGIDPVRRVDFRLLIAQFAKDATVVTTTHVIEDVALVGSNVIVIDEGRKVFQGNVVELEQAGANSDVTGMSAIEKGYYAVVSHS